MIDSYHSGQIVINGEAYTSDVTISPSGVKAWWRKKGHEVRAEDLDALISDKPEILVVGTGISGGVRIPPDVRRQIESKGISLVAETTDKACDTYNQLCRSQRVVAAFHLTC